MSSIANFIGEILYPFLIFMGIIFPALALVWFIVYETKRVSRSKKRMLKIEDKRKRREEKRAERTKRKAIKKRALEWRKIRKMRTIKKD